ncbi:MAG: DUF2975 domain-containing protein [Galbibacter orientalis]|uniref:DUF2975 domain-containing protein n=1 Tax=Galbibacter orientalis TaxID=453852 RepID=UPI0030026577
MKKISNILHLLLIAFQLFIISIIIAKTTHFFMKFDSVETNPFFGIHLSEETSSTSRLIIFGITLLLMIFLCYLINIFRNVILDFNQRLIFNKENGKQLKKVAIGLLFICLAILIITILSLPYHNLYEVLGAKDNAYRSGYNLGLFTGRIIGLLFPIIVPAIFILLISYIIKEGSFIKNENDLTI